MNERRELGLRLDDIVEVLLSIARLDFSRRLPVGEPDDPLAALAVGINMLAEELAETVASKRELEAAYRALRDAQAQLMHADKLAAIGQLAGGVAHEINNPVGAAILAHGMMADRLAALDAALLARGGDNDDLRRPLAELRTVLSDAALGIERIRSVVQDLRTFSRIDDESKGAVDLDDVVRIACNLARAEIRTRARLVLDLGRPPPVSGNRGRLGQVVTNLIVNAVQALPEGAPDEHEIRLSTRAAGDEVVFAIEDTGPGIPPEIESRIFEPFFTTKAPDVGTGLGLALVAEIVRKHDGRISVAGRPGRGARFEVRLPRSAPAQVRANAPPFSGQGSTLPPVPWADGRGLSVGAPGRARILVVDDDELILRTFKLILELDHEVVTAADGLRALEILDVDRSFDVIFCDLVMPGTDGVAVYEVLRRRSPELVSRLVFCTGGAYTDRLRTFLLSSAIPVLDKPFLPPQVSELIDRVRAPATGATASPA